MQPGAPRENGGDPDTTSRADVLRHCIKMITERSAYNDPPMPGLSGPLATPEFKVLLETVAPFKDKRVTCIKCARDLGRWTLNATNGVAVPHHRPPASLKVSPDIAAFTDRLAARKGPIVDSYTNDARGTITYKCKNCAKRTALKAETRTKLFLEAEIKGQKNVAI